MRLLIKKIQIPAHLFPEMQGVGSSYVAGGGAAPSLRVRPLLPCAPPDGTITNSTAPISSTATTMSLSITKSFL